MRGGAYLATRQVLGILIGFANVLVLTRLIGPRNYGLYAACLGITAYLSNMARLGIDVYLVRLEKDPSPQAYDQAFTAIFSASLIGMLCGLLAIPFLKGWYQDPSFIPPFLVMLATLPLTGLARPVMARLERDLDYRRIAGIDLSGQFAFCIVALFLGYFGKGVWAPVIGHVVWQIAVLIGGFAASRVIPRFHLSRPLLGEMMHYGLSYSVSLWVWQLRLLVNPLIVGRYGGLEAVGFVALTVRLTEQLSFVKGTVWQLSIPALAKLQGDFQRLKKALEEGMALQVLLVGPFLAGFALFGPWLFPILFGDRWRPIFLVYPFISLATLVNAVFNMHSSVLYVLKRNWSVALFHLSHIVLFSGSAFVFVARFDLLGYGLAELVAILSYIVIHIQAAKVLDLSYRKAWTWFSMFAPLLFAPFVPSIWVLLLFLPSLLILSNPEPRRQIAGYLRSVTGERQRPWQQTRS